MPARVDPRARRSVAVRVPAGSQPLVAVLPQEGATPSPAADRPGAQGSHGPVFATSWQDGRSLASRPGDPGSTDPLQDPADHRVADGPDRRPHTALHLQFAQSAAERPAGRLDGHDPRARQAGRAAAALRAGLVRQRQRPAAGETAGAAGGSSRAGRPGRDQPAAGRSRSHRVGVERLRSPGSGSQAHQENRAGRSAEWYRRSEHPAVRCPRDRQDGVHQGIGCPAGRESVQHRRVGRRRGRTEPPGTAPGTEDGAPAGARPQVDIAVRRNGGPARRRGRALRVWSSVLVPGAWQRGLEGVSESSAGELAGTDDLDHERRPHGQSRDPAAHDVRPGAAPAARVGQDLDLAAAASPPRDRSVARNRGRAGA